ncbi:hypothetical protein GCM10022206_43040 [Streptomyces chiangmaiensis]
MTSRSRCSFPMIGIIDSAISSRFFQLVNESSLTVTGLSFELGGAHMLTTGPSAPAVRVRLPVCRANHREEASRVPVHLCGRVRAAARTGGYRSAAVPAADGFLAR